MFRYEYVSGIPGDEPTRIGSPFSEQSTIHMFFRALVMATYKNFNYVRVRVKTRA
jgi:hypothetical protein